MGMAISRLVIRMLFATMGMAISRLGRLFSWKKKMVMAYAPAMAPIPVVRPEFCAPYRVDLTVTKQLTTIFKGNFVVLDVNGNLVYKVRRKLFDFHNRLVLLDPAGQPIITMQPKILTAHRRWQVYRGDSSDSKNRLFSVKTSWMRQFENAEVTRLDVFLAANTKENVCDFKIKKRWWFEYSYVIYTGNTNNIVAEMHKKHTVRSMLFGKNTFAVTVYPHVDSALITALIVVLNEINHNWIITQNY